MCKLPFKNKIRNWQDGSLAKGTCSHAWTLEFGPWSPLGRRGSTLVSCLFTFARTYALYAHTHKGNKYMFKINNKNHPFTFVSCIYLNLLKVDAFKAPPKIIINIQSVIFNEILISFNFGVQISHDRVPLHCLDCFKS